MKNRAWSGRFKSAQSKEFLKYSASIGFDKELAFCDIDQNIAHAAALKKARILTASEYKKIVTALSGIRREIAAGKFKFRVKDEDIHMNIERRLKEKAGDAAGKIHTGRSRNDQVVTDLRLYTREKAVEISALLQELRKAFLQQAKKNVDLIMPGYTHMQPAQPIRAAHWFLAYQEMFARDFLRFQNAMKSANISPLGSGALAGANFNIDRKLTARLMGFDGVADNSLDAVSDRDFALEFCFAVSMLFSHLSRFADEVIIYATAEFATVILPEELCTGSSIMPQKKNPDLLELLRAKAGRTAANLANMLMLLKGLPLAYNKDLQEDKPPLFDSAEQAVTSLPLATKFVKKMKFDKKVLKERLAKGFTTAVDVADYLVIKGMPFREAHHVVGKVVAFCEGKGITFSDITLKELKEFSTLFKNNVFDFIDPQKSPDRKKTLGSTSKTEILKNIKRLEKELK
ncbi:MAG: argininosuccinate lyase [Nitrospinota bacterium]